MTETTPPASDDMSDYRALMTELVERVRATIADLPEGYIVARAISDAVLDIWLDKVSTAPAPRLLRWPPTLLHSVRIAPEQLTRMDADVINSSLLCHSCEWPSSLLSSGFRANTAPCSRVRPESSLNAQPTRTRSATERRLGEIRSNRRHAHDQELCEC